MPTVSDLFAIRYGHSLELNRMTTTDPDSGVAFVSRKMGDNGVSAYVVPVRGETPAQPGELSVALGGNGVLSTFLHDRPFYTGRDVAILTPKIPMSKSSLIYYCMCIKANRYRYSYGRQANRSLRDIVLPDPNGLPKWVQETSTDRFAVAASPVSLDPVSLPPLGTWRAYLISDLFELRKGRRLTKADMRPGATPFIGAVDSGNGLTGFVAQEPMFPGNTITVNYNGNGVAEAFYQPIPYRCSDDVNVLVPKFPLTPAIAMFIATVIRLEKYRFNYGRKWHLERMAQSQIRLPATPDGNPDYAVMGRFVCSLSFSSQL